MVLNILTSNLQQHIIFQICRSPQNYKISKILLNDFWGFASKLKIIKQNETNREQ